MKKFLAFLLLVSVVFAGSASEYGSLSGLRGVSLNKSVMAGMVFKAGAKIDTSRSIFTGLYDRGSWCVYKGAALTGKWYLEAKIDSSAWYLVDSMATAGSFRMIPVFPVDSIRFRSTSAADSLSQVYIIYRQ